MHKIISLEITQYTSNCRIGNYQIVSKLQDYFKENGFDNSVSVFSVNNKLDSISVFDVKEKDVPDIRILLNEFVKYLA